MASGHVNRTERPNTWPHRLSLQREDSPCQLGAVHTWPIATNHSLQYFGRYWGHSGHWAALTPKASVANDSKPTCRRDKLTSSQLGFHDAGCRIGRHHTSKVEAGFAEKQGIFGFGTFLTASDHKHSHVQHFACMRRVPGRHHHFHDQQNGLPTLWPCEHGQEL
jgi:hypothetical protein